METSQKASSREKEGLNFIGGQTLRFEKRIVFGTRAHLFYCDEAIETRKGNCEKLSRVDVLLLQ